ncbi:TadE/TadG family type IV pilus assembly protein [Propylenella binzhouense]|uniref:Pilus assembly protein n=1 Tax=Propylenella binzhouense TaxID=2555902 RepID=A0A964T5F6_9HYPH|nr:TadE/TadG family type IV pilus assembly protein [Propylenella binzhouense]MYZ48808.1 pilus assembly protein [Propylenella binzhouense]
MRACTRLLRFAADRSGVAAIEFGLAAPVMILLFLGGFDMCRYLLANFKADRVAFSVADIVTQYKMVTSTEVADAFQAAAEIMDPFEFASDGVVIMSSVYRKDSWSTPVIRWQCTGGGTLQHQSALGAAGDYATLPPNVTLGARENLLIAEVFYDYHPLFSGVIPQEVQVYKTAIFRPRLGTLTSAPGC